MKPFALLPLLALLSAVPAPVLAQPAPAPANAVSPIALEKAMALLDVTAPAAEMEQQFSSNFVRSARAVLEANPRVKAMEAQTPGILDVCVNAMTQSLKRSVPGEMTQMRIKLAGLYAQGMTPEELDAATAFYRTPAGQRLLARINAGSQTSIDAMRSAGTLSAGAMEGQMTTVLNDATRQGVAGASPEDRIALQTFSMTAASRKMQALQPQMIALMSDQFHEMAERLGPPIRQDVLQAMMQFRNSH